MQAKCDGKKKKNQFASESNKVINCFNSNYYIFQLEYLNNLLQLKEFY